MEGVGGRGGEEEPLLQKGVSSPSPIPLPLSFHIQKGFPMKKHPRQRGYFGDTVRKGASGPGPGPVKRTASRHGRRTDVRERPGGLDAEEVLGLMGKSVIQCASTI